MKKRTIKLTENDLSKLIKKIINESEVFATHPLHQREDDSSKPSWFDAENDGIVSDPDTFQDEKSFGPGEYEDFKKFIKGCSANWCLNVKHWFDMYTNQGPITVRKRERPEF